VDTAYDGDKTYEFTIIIFIYQFNMPIYGKITLTHSHFGTQYGTILLFPLNSNHLLGGPIAIWMSQDCV
jgi:hypothetical protein